MTTWGWKTSDRASTAQIRTSGPLGSRWINFRIARYFGSGDDSLLTKLTPFTNLEALISTPFLTTVDHRTRIATIQIQRYPLLETIATVSRCYPFLAGICGARPTCPDLGGKVNLYWYVSRAKLDLLAQQAPGFFTGVKAKIGFKLPLLSGSLEGTEPSRTAEDLERVVKRLKSQNDILAFSDLAESDWPTLFSFEGPAVRQISDGVFWLAMERDKCGLLLAGSAASAIGSPMKSDGTFSPSADPLAAIKAVFNDTDPNSSSFDGTSVSLSGSLSYAWRTFMADASEGTLPKATGLALFARRVKADRAQMRLIQKDYITNLIIGSPLFIQQV